MTIQPSVVIWTVICFLALVLILDRLLFRPVLQVLDRRRERIRAAEAKKAEYERLTAEREARREQARADALIARKKQLGDELERVRAEGRMRVEAANEERVRRVDRYRVQTEADCARLLEMLSEQADGLAVSRAESLTK